MRVLGYFLKCVYQAIVLRRRNMARLLVLFILLALIVTTAVVEFKGRSIL